MNCALYRGEWKKCIDEIQLVLKKMTLQRRITQLRAIHRTLAIPS